MSDEKLIIYDAHWMEQKEPEHYGLFKTLEGAKCECQKHAYGKLKWIVTKKGEWIADQFHIWPIEVQE